MPTTDLHKHYHNSKVDIWYIPVCLFLTRQHFLFLNKCHVSFPPTINIPVRIAPFKRSDCSIRTPLDHMQRSECSSRTPLDHMQRPECSSRTPLDHMQRSEWSITFGPHVEVRVEHQNTSGPHAEIRVEHQNTSGPHAEIRVEHQNTSGPHAECSIRTPLDHMQMSESSIRTLCKMAQYDWLETIYSGTWQPWLKGSRNSLPKPRVWDVGMFPDDKDLC